MLIGVTGRAQHGKDTIGQILVDYEGLKRYAFADQLKDMLVRTNPFAITGEPVVRVADVVTVFGWEQAKTSPEIRRLLQALGVAVREVIGPDSWVEALQNILEADGAFDVSDGWWRWQENVVVTDVRFPNEAEWVNAVGGRLIRVTRPGFDSGIGTDHPSEAFVDSLPVDIDIVNDGSIGDLEDKVVAFVAGIRPKAAASRSAS